jgi:integrase
MSHFVPKIHLWNRGTKRRPNYWVRYSVDASEQREGTGARDLPGAQAFVQTLERMFRLGQWEPPASRSKKERTAFRDYALVVISRRMARGVKGAAKDETGHVLNHLAPAFDGLAMEDLTFRVIRDAFEQIKGKGLAGATVINIHSTLRAILFEAAEDEIFPFPPPPLTVARGHLPPPIEVRPDRWREKEVSSRDEIAKLLSCDAIDTQYRVMYATYFLTGSRFNEVTTLRVRDLDLSREPLPSLTIRALKTARDKGPMYRVVPVHPDLLTWLTWWLQEEYEVLHGARPGPDDLLFPTLSQRRRNARLRNCSHGEIYKRWSRHHLPAAGLTHRRLHSSRLTFISLVRSSSSSRDIVRSFTHRASQDRVLDAYTVFEWQALCAELARVTWSLPAPPAGQSQSFEPSPTEQVP